MAHPQPPTPIKLSNGIRVASWYSCYFSHKGGDRLVETYTLPELAHAHLLEGSSEVVAFREQPLKIPGIRSTGRAYVLDAWVYFCDHHQEYRELTRTSRLECQADGTQCPKDWAAASEAIRKLGATPVFLTDDDLEPFARRIDHWTRVMPHIARAYYLDRADLRTRIYRHVVSRPPCTLGEVQSAFPTEDPLDVWAQTFRLVQEQQLAAPLDDEPPDRCLRLMPGSEVA